MSYNYNHKISKENQNLINLRKRELILIKKISLSKYLGVSIYNPSELNSLISNKYLKVFQIPFNVLDNRFKNFFKILKKNNKKIFVRSIFMQGLIFANKWPPKIKKYKKTILNKLNFFTNKFERINNIDLCIAYINYYKQIDGVIIGIDNKTQLFQIFSFLENKPLTYPQVKEIDKYFKKIPQIVYDVRGWNL